MSAVERFLEHELERGVEPATLAKKRRALEGFERWLGRPAETASAVELERWYRDRCEAVSIDWRRRNASSVRSFLAWLVDDGALSAAPALAHPELRSPRGARVSDPLVLKHLRWCELRNLRPVSVNHRRGTLSRLERWLGHEPSTATAAELAGWYDDYAGRVTPKTRGVGLTDVRCFYEWLVDEGYRPDSPARRLARPRWRRSVPRPIPRGELELALALVDEPARAWLMLAAFAGLRACEIAGLRGEHVLDHLDPPMLHVVDGKGGVERIVPLHPDVLDALPRNRSGALWTLARGQAPNANNVSMISNRALRALGITHTFHSLRHLFATEIYAATLDLRVTQELLGHASPATTAIYAAFSKRSAISAVHALSVPSVVDLEDVAAPAR